MIPFELSTNLGHTWFFDLDGTILKHNGRWNGGDELLPGVKELWDKIPPGDCIVITTGRETEYIQESLDFLDQHNLRYNHVLCNLPLGERIVINDEKPEGLQTAIAWNVKRDAGFKDL